MKRTLHLGDWKVGGGWTPEGRGPTRAQRVGGRVAEGGQGNEASRPACAGRREFGGRLPIFVSCLLRVYLGEAVGSRVARLQ